MANYFLKVDKGLFGSGLNPLEILLVSQINEFQVNTGDCFISDKKLAENFGVSESTITRALKSLETKGYITRYTRNTNTGKERHIKVNSAIVNLPVEEERANSKLTFAQESICTLRKQQNDLIKDNINKINEKDNLCFLERKRSKKGDACQGQAAIDEPVEIDGVKAQVMNRQEATNKYGIGACANRVSTPFTNCFWISGELVQLEG